MFSDSVGGQAVALWEGLLFALLHTHCIFGTHTHTHHHLSLSSSPPTHPTPIQEREEGHHVVCGIMSCVFSVFLFVCALEKELWTPLQWHSKVSPRLSQVLVSRGM